MSNDPSKMRLCFQFSVMGSFGNCSGQFVLVTVHYGIFKEILFIVNTIFFKVKSSYWYMSMSFYGPILLDILQRQK